MRVSYKKLWKQLIDKELKNKIYDNLHASARPQLQSLAKEKM
jgi:hypothetical protein